MRSLTPPAFDLSDILAALGHGPRINRVHHVSGALLEGEVEYVSRARGLTLWASDPSHASISDAEEDDVRYAYESKLVDKEGAARAFYNALRTAPYNRCPICQERDVAALDHYLPRERWPRFSIVPLNLIPICQACNMLKSSRWAVTGEKRFLHPYFDNLGGVPWLDATLVEQPGAPLRFEVAHVDDWEDDFTALVTLHFERFKLAELFSDHAATLLSSYRIQLLAVAQLGGVDAVRELLCGTAQSFRAAAVDLWSALALETWAASDWFCQGDWDT